MTAPALGGGALALVAPGTEMRSGFVMPDGELPWLSDADLDVYVDEFERSGFVGPLNRYRNIDRDWEDLQAMRGRPIDVPALFIGGDRDGPTLWGHRNIERFPDTVPNMRGVHVLAGCGHWTQQERVAEVDALLLDFLSGL